MLCRIHVSTHVCGVHMYAAYTYIRSGVQTITGIAPPDCTTSMAMVVIHAHGPTPVDKLEKRFIAQGWSRTTKGRRDDSAQCSQADAQAIDVRLFRSVSAEDLGSLSASLRMVS